MRRSLLALALTITAVTATACGGGSTGTAAMKQEAAAPTSAAMTPATTDAMAADSSPAPTSPAPTSPAATSPAAKAAGIPQITVTEEDAGNDGDMAKLPQGLLGAKAVAAGLGKDGVPVITVTGTDTSCLPDRTSVPAGKVWFKLVSKGQKVNELYLESAKGDELVEVEKVKTGMFGAFKTTVKAGGYLIACEPGQADTQIRTPLTVTPAR
jgi:hypothetical protein